MAYNYTVYYGTAAATNNGTNPLPTGWTLAGSVATPNDTVSGLAPAQSYYFNIVPVDTTSNLSGPPTVAGPYSTSTNPTAPVVTVTGVQQNQVTLNWTSSS